MFPDEENEGKEGWFGSDPDIGEGQAEAVQSAAVDSRTILKTLVFVAIIFVFLIAVALKDSGTTKLRPQEGAVVEIPVKQASPQQKADNAAMKREMQKILRGVR